MKGNIAMSNNNNLNHKNNIITLSFKQTPYEQNLLNDILSVSQLLGKSAWIKLACIEKLQHDSISTNLTNTTNYTNNQYSNSQYNTLHTQNTIPNADNCKTTPPLLDVDLGM